MTLKRAIHHCRILLLLSLVPIMGLVAACEARNDTTADGESTPTSQTTFRAQGRVVLGGRQIHSGTHVFLGGTSYSVWTDSRGQYAFDGLHVGNYELIAEKPGYGDVIRQIEIPANSQAVVEIPTLTLSPLRAETQPTTQTLVLATPVPTPAATPAPTPLPSPVARGNRIVTGQVLVFDAQGKMTIDFPAITAYIDELNLSTPLLPDGSFAFTQLPARELVVTAQGQNYHLEAPARVDLRDTARANVVLRVQAVAPTTQAVTGDVTGTIVVAEGVQPPKAIRVALAGTQFSGVADDKGVFQFKEVPAGKYVLVVEADKFETMRLPGVEVTAGDAVDLGELLLDFEINPPRVVETTPQDGAHRVLIQSRTPVIIRFNKEMDRRTVKDAFSIRPTLDYQIFFGNENPHSNEKTLYVEILGESPDRFPRFDTTYTAIVSTSATDLDGTPMEKNHEFSFTTGGPSVVQTYPAEGARNVPVDLNRSVRFVLNDQINPRQRPEDYIRVRPALPAAPRVDVFEDPYSGWTVIQLYAIWKPETNYRVTLERGLQSVEEKRYENIPYNINFTTSQLKTLVPLSIEPRQRIRPTERTQR